MGKEKIKLKNNTLLLINKLGKFERVNQEELKILMNCAVAGLAPVSAEVKRKKVILQVAAQNWIPLTAYLSGGMDAETALTFIWNTLRIAYDCERYGLRIDNLSWNFDRVFVDGSNGALYMIYWPVTTLERAPETPLSFYASFCDVLDQCMTDRTIIQTYRAYFYQRDVFDYPMFYQMVQSVLDRWRNYKAELQRRARREQEENGRNWFRPDSGYSVCTGWLENNATGEKIYLNQEKTTFGRDGASSDVAIANDAGVSRRHAAVLNRDDQYYLVDLGSKNGTYVQSRRLAPQERILLTDGVTVTISRTSYTFHKSESNRTISIHQLQRRK